MKTGLAASVLGLLLVDCTSTAPAATPQPSPEAAPTASFPTPAPTPTLIGTLTLTESACALERAQARLGPGPATLNVINRTRGAAWVDLSRIGGGKTYEDLGRDIEFAAEAARGGKPVVPRPAYLERAIPPLILNAGGSAALNATLETGTYGIVCLRTYDNINEIRPYLVAGPLEVR